MAWDYFIKRFYRSFYKPKNKKNMKDEKLLDTKKSFLEGMGSIWDLRGKHNLNEVTNYLNELSDYSNNPSERIGRCWHDAGSHLHDAMDSFARQNNLSCPSPFNKKYLY